MKKLIWTLSWLFMVIPCMAETIGPGKYACMGRVIKKANREFSVFLGGGCYTFPVKLQKKLKPYLGKFVKIDYTRISEKEAGFVTSVGSVIDRIDKVTIIGNDPNDLPVTVRIRPVQKEFRLIEPINLSAVVINRGNEAARLHLYSATTYLCQDYKMILALEPENHYYQEHPYKKSELKQLHVLQPGQKVEFTITSQQMGKSGNYQLVHAFRLDNGFPIQSEFQTVVILPPVNKNEYIKALKFWLVNASPGQRVDIAEHLLTEGDSSGKEEVLRLLLRGEYSKKHYLFADAFRFAWQYGGKDGESAMLSIIKTQNKQNHILRMIERIHLSKNRVVLLEILLSDNHKTYRDISGWCDRPRVSDITSAWLAGYTDGKIQFPRNGSERERDAAVALVLKKLKEDPEFFQVLSKSYK